MEKLYTQLIKATDLFGKVNTKLAKMKNPYLLTYILEAVDSISSNDIENIHTTVDEAFQDLVTDKVDSPFYNYREALKQSHRNLMASELILIKDIKLINKRIRGVDGEFRKTPVSIKDSEGKVIHKPIDANKIPSEMEKLVNTINQDREKNQILNALDIHHQFEWIHPFSDGNGRTGRILFALLLNKYEILNIPASVFSYSLMKSKDAYYKALKLADQDKKNDYYIIMLELLNESLELTLKVIDDIIKILSIRLENRNEKESKIIEYIFAGVKTSNKYLAKKTGLNNKTVSKYVDLFVKEGFLVKENKGKYVAYKNLDLDTIISKYFQDIK